MDWDALDFAIFGALLAVVATVLTVTIRKTGNAAYRLAVGVAVGAAFLLVWINGAVGIIGHENNDANMLYFGVLAVGGVGAVIARFRPNGMARALVATSLAQVLVAVIALGTGTGITDPGWPWDIVLLTLFFAALWLTSAWLFRSASRHARPA